MLSNLDQYQMTSPVNTSTSSLRPPTLKKSPPENSSFNAPALSKNLSLSCIRDDKPPLSKNLSLPHFLHHLEPDQKNTVLMDGWSSDRQEQHDGEKV
jgi:hypothetical protein